MTSTLVAHSALFAAAALVTTGVASTAAAQSVRTSPAISLQAGAFQYDLSRAVAAPSAGRGAIGTAPMLALRAAFPLGQAVLVEPSLVVARPQRLDSATTFVIPEVQVQAQLPFGSVRPYIGIGCGVAMERRRDDAGAVQSHFTGSSAAGLRWWLTERVAARGELRLRGIGRDFTGSSSEWTLGLAWRF